LEDQEIENKKSARKKYRALRIFGKIILGILLFIFLIILFIRSPWGQSVIVDNVVSYISNKTNTKVEIKNLFVTFDGKIQLDGLYLEDKKGDTLIYSKSIEANVPLWSMIRGEGIGVDALNWEGVRVNFVRKDSIQGFNFQFLMDAFATTETTSAQSKATTAPINIVLGKLNFKDIDIIFDDAVAGIESRFKIGTLKAVMNKTDLELMTFEASTLVLSDSKIKFIQKPVPIDPNAEVIPLPSFTVENLTLKNVMADYQSYGDRKG
jgi:uncharacterized protein involved in outer membrane biogenesis